MAITNTLVRNTASVMHIAVGRYIDTGTVAAFTITTGFKPLYVKVQNLAATGSTSEWYSGMAAASAVKRITAGDMTVPTSNGITQLPNGFTVGLDTDLVVSSEQISWYCLG